MLEAALRLRRPGPYQLQAAIAALHAGAPSWAATDWPPDRRPLRARSPVRRRRPSSRSTGRSRSGWPKGPCAGLAVLEAAAADPRLRAYQPLHAARAELLRRAGDAGGADAAYARAIALSANAVERAELERRRAAAAEPGPPPDAGAARGAAP